MALNLLPESDDSRRKKDANKTKSVAGGRMREPLVVSARSECVAQEVATESSTLARTPRAMGGGERLEICSARQPPRRARINRSNDDAPLDAPAPDWQFSAAKMPRSDLANATKPDTCIRQTLNAAAALRRILLVAVLTIGSLSGPATRKRLARLDHVRQ